MLLNDLLSEKKSTFISPEKGSCVQSTKTIQTIGLIVNPLAGIGGRVGLKGSDGEDTVKRAFSLGAERLAPERAVETLRELFADRERFTLLTYPKEMGEEEALRCSYTPTVLGSIQSGHTTSEDTRKAAQEMLEKRVDLIIFVGGDGTARDIYEAVGTHVAVLGIPAGVKIHSSVYAINPRRAADLVHEFLQGHAPSREMEVMDIDEDLFRQGQVSARLYGYLLVPYERRLVQGAKAASTGSGESLCGIAAAVVDRMTEEEYYILGPGTTVKAIGDELKIDKTLLGVDLVFRKKMIGKDLNERQILEMIDGKKAKIVVTVIGGQGYIFGRGNQQISPRVIQAAGKKNIIIVAAKNKLISLQGPLLVDTGDPQVDSMLSGFVRVVTGFDEETVWKVEC
jgi:predicted polyphosphate/ATP-dependent NAD kinase